MDNSSSFDIEELADMIEFDDLIIEDSDDLLEYMNDEDFNLDELIELI